MADDSLVIGLKGLIRKYLMLFPFVRKADFVEIMLNPSAALPKEMASSSIFKGFKDNIVPAYVSTIFGLLVGLAVELAIPTAGLGSTATVLSAFGFIALLALIALPFTVIIGMAFTAAVYVLAAKLLGGKGEFGRTMGILGTISGPIYLLGIVPSMIDRIPICGIVGSLAAAALGIYQIYLNFRMVQSSYGFGGWKRPLAVVLSPIALLTMLLVLAITIAIMTIGSAAMLSYMNGMAPGLQSSG
jgi:hypothetical protein